ncbi:hypothetical protein [Bryobacter aggregatus]|uniref:hypothetical protein n=1 Tax=Bryobacter aggregatus TaxID=360054 RepID=UPI0004E25DC5|nr:hypothetical protein [Bryobacter aggregatus]
MAIAIVPNSAEVVVKTRPGVGVPVVNATSVNFPGRIIECTGKVQISGLPTDARAGWFVGWIQAQWIETNWGYFRGQTNGDGSAFHQRARPPARPAQACRDTVGPVNDIFYSMSADLRKPVGAGPFPQTISVVFRDTPSETYPISVTNSLTGKPNFLREVQLEFHFCTIFLVRDPAGKFHQLKHLYWNMHWQYRFSPTAAGSLTATAIPGGVSANVSRVFTGPSTDHRFANVLTSPQANSCNQVAAQASTNPNVRESRVWDNFDVRR